MNKNNVLVLGSLLLFILGITIIILAFRSGPKVLIPPVITGLGFFVIAWIFMALREK